MTMAMLVLLCECRAGAQSPPPRSELGALVGKFQSLVQRGGPDLPRALELDQQSRRAMQQGRPDEAVELLRQAIAVLDPQGGGAAVRPAGPPAGPPPGAPPGAGSSPLASAPGPAVPLPPETERSPFGVHAPFLVDRSTAFPREELLADLDDMGVRWVRLILPEADLLAADLAKRGIGVLAIAGGPGNRLPADRAGFESTLRAAVRRNRGVVKCWQVGNEPDLLGPAAAEYLPLLKASYGVIKSECPECTVVLGGLGYGNPAFEAPGAGQALEYLRVLLEGGAAGSFDVFDLHFPGTAAGYARLGERLSSFRALLGQYGAGGVPVWITEMSTYTGSPVPLTTPGLRIEFPQQSEAAQAAALVRLYVTGLRFGVGRMFWNLLVERNGFAGVKNGYYDNAGVLRNPDNGRGTGRKLAYYAYRKMTEVFRGAETGGVEVIREGDGTCIYRFARGGKSLWVVWAEGDGATLEVPGVRGVEATLTLAVPAAATGADVSTPAGGYTTLRVPVTDGKVRVRPGANVAFVEED
jgi:hypothetical protein